MDFKIVGNQFVKDGVPTKIISGAVHYFRNMQGTWRDIFKKLVALGCNCVETYCAWNMHEKQVGVFDFEGNLDIAEFIKIAGEEGLMVIVRPGPYICSEWEFGGLPWWLQTMDDMEIRCCNETYVRHFENYLKNLFDQIRPLLFTNGGPIIMLQCENEYGYYGDDKVYLNKLRDMYRDLGIDVPLFTSDGTSENNLLDGTIKGCLATLNFGSRVEENFKAHDKLFPDSPKMCMEMWCGWFDDWGCGFHHKTSAQDYAKVADDMLQKGSFNMYMFIGGTNFGFTSGANHYEKFRPDVTSYDYDAPLSECGDTTEKYFVLRDVIKKYVDKELPPVPANREKRGYGRITLDSQGGFFDNLDNLSSPIFSNVPKCMEHYGQGYGYIAYTTTLNRDYKDTPLRFEDLGDRAQVYVNRTLQGIVYVNDDELKTTINAHAGDTLTILVENMGRANFGPKMMRKKGIAGRLLLGDNIIHFNWQVYPLPMDNLDKVVYGNNVTEPTRFYKGTLMVDKVADTFIRLDDFTKGFILVNGFNIGRYWEIGPQKNYYIPACLLKEGENEIVIFESDGAKVDCPSVEFLDKPDLG
ncbi:MAG: beta-galactosidase [Clostridia bacterium]|nr:beta-galactosidase [Clostridia bacterium]